MAQVRAMVLAAGLGTRLRPLTLVRPKPVVPLLDRPLATYALEHLRRSGIEEVALNTHHLAHVMRTVLGERCSTPAGDVALRYVHEPEIRGTGGGIAGMLPLMGGETFVVTNADVLYAPDLGAALAHHRRLGAIATLVVRSDPDVARWGAVEIDDAGRVLRIVGKPTSVARVASRACMFAGVHIVEPELAAHLPEIGCVIRQTYQPLLAAGATLGAFVDDAPWRDLGDVRAYLDTNRDLVAGRVRWPGVVPPADARWIATDAAIDERASLGAEVIVGARSRIGPHRLERAVVWPDANVTSDVIDAVAFADGQLARP